jgi:Cu/Zn superoxide dismutase
VAKNHQSTLQHTTATQIKSAAGDLPSISISGGYNGYMASIHE